jgi:hypothetical protein
MIADMTRRVVAALGAAALVSLLAGACGAEVTPAAGTPNTSRPPSSTSTAESSTPAPPTSASPTTGLPSGTILLGLGDSVPGAGGPCQTMGDFCRSYVLVLADLATKALGRPVTAVNMAFNNDVTSASMLLSVKTDVAMREAITKASIITVQVGNNDWQGPCHWPGAACLEEARPVVVGNIRKALDEIGALRGGSLAGVRVVTYADTTWETDDLADAWGFDKATETAAFHAMFTKALKALNASTCQVARAHKAVCIDLLPALNGPSGSTAPGLGGIHPDTAGHEKIAAVIAKAGFADVK